jgi:hypothetical protein
LAANTVWHSSRRIAASPDTVLFASRRIFIVPMLADPPGDCKSAHAEV